jgi:hypothetical protein
VNTRAPTTLAPPAVMARPGPMNMRGRSLAATEPASEALRSCRTRTRPPRPGPRGQCAPGRAWFSTSSSRSGEIGVLHASPQDSAAGLGPGQAHAGVHRRRSPGSAQRRPPRRSRGRRGTPPRWPYRARASAGPSSRSRRPGPTARMSATVSTSSRRMRSGLCTMRAKSATVRGSETSRFWA